jgi:hypothetical protein
VVINVDNAGNVQALTLLDTAATSIRDAADGAVPGHWKKYEVNEAELGPRKPKLLAGSEAGTVVLPTKLSKPA